MTDYLLFKFVILRTVVSESRYLNQNQNNLTRGITPKRVTSGGVHILGVAPGQYSSEGTLQRLRAAGDRCRA